MGSDRVPRKRPFTAVSSPEREHSSKRFKLDLQQTNKDEQLIKIPSGGKSTRKEQYKQQMLAALKKEKEVYFSQLQSYDGPQCKDCDDCMDIFELNKPH